MVVALLTTDNRENFREYAKNEPWFGTAPEALLQGFSGLRELTVHVVSCAQQPMHSPKQLAANVFFHNVVVPKLGWLRTGYQGCIRAVRRKLRELRPDIAHGQGTERDCAVSAVFSGYPNVITIHGNMRLIAKVNQARPFTYQWLAARLERYTIPRTDGVVCITSYTQRAMAGLARRTWVVPNAVDRSFFDIPRQAPDAPAKAEAPTILCVGNVQHRKNQNAYIHSLDEVAKSEPFRLLFLGAANADDDYTREFHELVRGRPWCVHGGMASRGELKQHLTAAAALALPSLEDNCPMVVLEAMAAGVPVMAANVGGVPELVNNGVTGLWCDPHSAQSMCDATIRLLKNRSLAASLAQAGRKEATERFHPEQIAHRHVEIYREVLALSGRPR